MADKIYTREDIDQILRSNPKSVGRAMIRLYELQTKDEQQSEHTLENNGRGFCSYAAQKGTYYARWVLSGRELIGKHLDNALKIALKHSGQLVAIANTPKNNSVQTAQS